MAQMTDHLALSILHGSGATRHEIEQLCRSWLGLLPQQTLMRYCPVTGQLTPYPSDARGYRKRHGLVAWLYNPWTGTQRNARDIGSDPFGELILPPDEQLTTVSESAA